MDGGGLGGGGERERERKEGGRFLVLTRGGGGGKVLVLKLFFGQPFLGAGTRMRKSTSEWDNFIDLLGREQLVAVDVSRAKIDNVD